MCHIDFLQELDTLPCTSFTLAVRQDEGASLDLPHRNRSIIDLNTIVNFPARHWFLALLSPALRDIAINLIWQKARSESSESSGRVRWPFMDCTMDDTSRDMVLKAQQCPSSSSQLWPSPLLSFCHAFSSRPYPSCIRRHTLYRSSPDLRTPRLLRSLSLFWESVAALCLF